jgi:hypothetical protein
MHGARAVKQTTIRILTALAVSTSLLACVTDEMTVLDEEEAIVRDGEAEFSAVTARNVDASASLATAVANPLIVPLVVEIYDDPGFRGARRNIVVDEPRFAGDGACKRHIRFENVASAVIVREGPDYATFKAAHGEPYAVLYEHPHFQGRRLVLGVGGYSDLIRNEFENVASSLKFTTGATVVVSPDVPSVTPMRPLTAIIEGHMPPADRLCREPDNVLTIVRTSGDLGRDFGSAWNDTLSYFEIIPTRTFNPAGELTVYRHDEFEGFGDGWRFDQLEINLGDYDIDNQVSSYRRSL